MQTKPSDAAFLAVFNLVQCRSEAAGDVISGTVSEYIGADVHASFGAYKLNSCRITQLFVQPDPFCTLLCSIE